MPGSATRRGISSHELVYAFEAIAKQLRDCGYSARDAEHQALYCTYRLGGMTDAEARADATEIYPKEKG